MNETYRICPLLTAYNNKAKKKNELNKKKRINMLQQKMCILVTMKSERGTTTAVKPKQCSLNKRLKVKGRNQEREKKEKTKRETSRNIACLQAVNYICIYADKYYPKKSAHTEREHDVERTSRMHSER